MEVHPEIVRGARHMIAIHGREAADLAERSGGNLRLSGAPDAAETWERMARAIRFIETGAPSPRD